MTAILLTKENDTLQTAQQTVKTITIRAVQPVHFVHRIHVLMNSLNPTFKDQP